MTEEYKNSPEVDVPGVAKEDVLAFLRLEFFDKYESTLTSDEGVKKYWEERNTILTAQYLGDEGEQVQDREKECKVLKEELTKELAQCAGIMDTTKVSLQTAVSEQNFEAAVLIKQKLSASETELSRNLLILEFVTKCCKLYHKLVLQAACGDVNTLFSAANLERLQKDSRDVYSKKLTARLDQYADILLPAKKILFQMMKDATEKGAQTVSFAIGMSYEGYKAITANYWQKIRDSYQKEAVVSAISQVQTAYEITLTLDDFFPIVRIFSTGQTNFKEIERAVHEPFYQNRIQVETVDVNGTFYLLIGNTPIDSAIILKFWDPSIASRYNLASVSNSLLKTCESLRIIYDSFGQASNEDQYFFIELLKSKELLAIVIAELKQGGFDVSHLAISPPTYSQMDSTRLVRFMTDKTYGAAAVSTKWNVHNGYGKMVWQAWNCIEPVDYLTSAKRSFSEMSGIPRSKY
jgi:hypothetical protein